MPLKLPKIGGLGQQQSGYGARPGFSHDPTDPWDPLRLTRDFARRDAELQREDERNFKRGQDIQVGNARLILKSPNGTQYALTVDDAGLISAVAI